MEKVHVGSLRRTAAGPFGPPWEDVFLGLADGLAGARFLCFPDWQVETPG